MFIAIIALSPQIYSLDIGLNNTQGLNILIPSTSNNIFSNTTIIINNTFYVNESSPYSYNYSTLNHNTTRISETFGFGTVMNNTLERPVIIRGSFSYSYIAFMDCAYITFHGNGTSASPQFRRIGRSGITAYGGSDQVDFSTEYETFFFEIPAGGKWQINSTTCGSGSVAMLDIWSDYDV